MENAESATKNNGKAKAKPAKAVASATDTKEIRIPLGIYNEKLDILPKSVAEKATKAGVDTTSGNRTWGPKVHLSQAELKKTFDAADALYRDKETDKSTKTYAYQLRKAASEAGEIEIANVRKYNRKPKAETVAPQRPAQPEMVMAASMPPRGNLERAAASLDLIKGILRDNGQANIATMLESVTTDIALPEVPVEAEVSAA